MQNSAEYPATVVLHDTHVSLLRQVASENATPAPGALLLAKP